MAQAKEIYWHIPGFCYFRLLNQVLINMMKDYSSCFRDGYRIGSVYGTFPGAIWNGGRQVFGIAGKTDMVKILNAYNNKDIPVRFTWTNSLITEKHINDTYCNLIMRLADNGMNQVLTHTDVLEQYLRKEYPNYKVISSTTKRMLDLETLKEELSKDYFLVVLDYDLNHNEKVLQEIRPYADKVEILVDEICQPGCTLRAQHYRENSRMQLEFDQETDFKCPNLPAKKVFSECMKRSTFISKDEIAQYAENGFVNFKLGGRGLPEELVKESYLYYLVKDGEREFIRAKMDKTLKELRSPVPAGRGIAPTGQRTMPAGHGATPSSVGRR